MPGPHWVPASPDWPALRDLVRNKPHPISPHPQVHAEGRKPKAISQGLPALVRGSGHNTEWIGARQPPHHTSKAPAPARPPSPERALLPRVLPKGCLHLPHRPPGLGMWGGPQGSPGAHWAICLPSDRGTEHSPPSETFESTHCPSSPSSPWFALIWTPSRSHTMTLSQPTLLPHHSAPLTAPSGQCGPSLG